MTDPLLDEWKNDPNHQGVHTCDGRCASMREEAKAMEALWKVVRAAETASKYILHQSPDLIIVKAFGNLLDALEEFHKTK